MIYEICFSPTGGTQKVLKMISQCFDGIKEFIDLSQYKTDYSKYHFSDEDLCIVAVPSFGGRVPAIALERLRQMKSENAQMILICVYGNRDFDDTLLELKECLQSHFHIVAAISAIAKHSIMNQFASDRPNEEDEMQLREFSERIKEKMNKKDWKEVIVPGKKPYKDYHGVPLKPSVSDDCVKCGLCASECPTHAIDESNPKITNKEICISCMRCLSLCPHQARKVNPLMVKASVLKLKKVCEVKKENQLFL